MLTRVGKAIVLAVFLAAVVFGYSAVGEAMDGCVYDEGLNTCIDTEFCCVIPGQCERHCQVFTDHCHCVPVG